jgi:hypothetical protein
MGGLLYASAIVIGSFVAAAPLCNETIDVAGGSLPDIGKLSSISTSAVKGFQLALFLENLEASFFQTGLTNITEWSIDGYPNDTIEVVTGVAAVSCLAPKPASTNPNPHSKKRFTLPPLLIYLKTMTQLSFLLATTPFQLTPLRNFSRLPI